MNYLSNTYNWVKKALLFNSYNYVFVGAMGYSGQKFDEQTARKMVNEAFDLIERKYRAEFNFALVSGYTDLGIPGIAYQEAVKRGWKTVGVACSLAKKYKRFPCNLVFIIGDEWGQESPTFLEMCDVFLRVGGGKQTIAETKAAKDLGKQVIEFDLEALPA